MSNSVKNGLKPGEPPPNINYIAIGTKYSNKKLYDSMKIKAGQLYDAFIGSRGHIGNVRVRVEKVLEKVPGIDYADLDKTPSTISVKALFDTGSDGGAMTSSLYDRVFKIGWGRPVLPPPPPPSTFLTILCPSPPVPKSELKPWVVSQVEGASLSANSPLGVTVFWPQRI